MQSYNESFWEKIAKNPTYKKIFKNPFTYVTGAVLLSVFQIALFAVSGNPWGVSGVCELGRLAVPPGGAAAWISGITSPPQARRAL